MKKRSTEGTKGAEQRSRKKIKLLDELWKEEAENTDQHTQEGPRAETEEGQRAKGLLGEELMKRAWEATRMEIEERSEKREERMLRWLEWNGHDDIVVTEMDLAECLSRLREFAETQRGDGTNAERQLPWMRQQISLTQALGEGGTHEGVGRKSAPRECRLEIDKDTLDRWMNADVELWTDLGELEKVHVNAEITYDWTNLLKEEDKPRVTNVDVYTDGSFTKRRGTERLDEETMETWAFAAIAQIEGESDYRFVGFTGGVVKEGWTTALGKQGSQRAETVAAVKAMQWWLKWKQKGTLTVHIDNKAVQGAAAGENSMRERTMLRTLRGICHYINAEDEDARFMWVKAHAGHPWNELADSVATAMAKRKEEPGPGKAEEEGEERIHTAQMEWTWTWKQRSPTLPRMTVHGPQDTAKVYVKIAQTT